MANLGSAAIASMIFDASVRAVSGKMPNTSTRHGSCSRTGEVDDDVRSFASFKFSGRDSMSLAVKRIFAWTLGGCSLRSGCRCVGSVRRDCVASDGLACWLSSARFGQHFLNHLLRFFFAAGCIKEKVGFPSPYGGSLRCTFGRDTARLRQ